MLSDNLPLTPGKEAEGGMSFTMLCQLISEGRAEEVPGIQHIPDELNVSGHLRSMWLAVCFYTEDCVMSLR